MNLLLPGSSPSFPLVLSLSGCQQHRQTQEMGQSWRHWNLFPAGNRLISSLWRQIRQLVNLKKWSQIHQLVNLKKWSITDGYIPILAHKTLPSWCHQCDCHQLQPPARNQTGP
ncbi:hypothetical protein R6Z07F_016046 [Ovis aries]